MISKKVLLREFISFIIILSICMAFINAYADTFDMVIDSVYCDSSVVYIGGRINIPDTAVSVGLYAPDGTPYLLKNIK